MSDDFLRSFGRIQARKLRPEQVYFVEEVLPSLAVDIDQPGSLSFDKKLCIEIGFGKGEHLAGYAKNHPDIQFIGCEPFLNGVARLVKYVHEAKLSNVKIFHGDARLLLEKLPDDALEKVFILFPDPWPKAKHHKKRIINNRMLSLLCKKIKQGASLEVATDHVEYAEWIEQHLLEFDGLKMEQISVEPPHDWVRTNYQAKAEKQGRGAKFFNFSVV